MVYSITAHFQFFTHSVFWFAKIGGSQHKQVSCLLRCFFELAVRILLLMLVLAVSLCAGITVAYTENIISIPAAWLLLGQPSDSFLRGLVIVYDQVLTCCFTTVAWPSDSFLRGLAMIYDHVLTCCLTTVAWPSDSFLVGLAMASVLVVTGLHQGSGSSTVVFSSGKVKHKQVLLHG